MRLSKTDISGWVVRGLYLFAFILIFWPAVDLLTNTMPFRPGDVRWRYGFGGILAGFLHTPILGLVLATFVAYGRRSRVTLRAIASLELLGALVLVLVMGMFALDVVQMRAMRPPDSLSAFIAGAAISEAKHFTAFLVLLSLGIGSWKTGALMDEAPSRAAADAPRGIVAASGGDAVMSEGRAVNAGRAPVVFFVDDEPGIRGSFSTLMRRRGFQVLEAGSAEEAGRLIEIYRDPIDVLLMDINLPDGWGATLAQALLEEHPEMTVIYTTGYAEEDPILSGALNDARFVLRKPFSSDELLELIRQAMAQAEREADGDGASSAS